MELQSFRSIFAIIAIIAVVIELVTFFRKFPKPSELAFSKFWCYKFCCL